MKLRDDASGGSAPEAQSSSPWSNGRNTIFFAVVLAVAWFVFYDDPFWQVATGSSIPQGILMRSVGAVMILGLGLTWPGSSPGTSDWKTLRMR